MATKKNNGSSKTTRVETEKRRCAVKLSLIERDKRGDEMADCEVKIEALKAQKSELARQVKTHEKRRNELGHALDSGSEERELMCTWHPDFKQNAFLLKRPDTQETVDTRPMTAGDRTADLFGDDDAPAPVHSLHSVPKKPPRSPSAPPPRKRGRPAKPTLTQPNITPPSAA